MLEASGIETRIGGTALLTGVDLAVEPGRAVAVVGPSGGGKTTLLRALAMIEPPTAGTITLDGRRFSFPAAPGAKLAPPWPEITLVFQQLFLWPHLTLRENMLLPVRLRRGEAAARAAAGTLVEELGLTGIIDRHPNEVSVGQGQRAALARALLLRPRYLLLDEVTSAQDVEHTFMIESCLRRFCREGGSAVIASHLIGFARRIADRVAFMEHGTFVESGAVNILETPVTRRFRDFLAVGV